MKHKKILEYLAARLKEKSTRIAMVSALSAAGWSLSAEQTQIVFQVATFVLALLAAGAKEKTVEK